MTVLVFFPPTAACCYGYDFCSQDQRKVSQILQRCLKMLCIYI